ncbi:Hypothetical protein CINCED_3A012107 [Cinara cedri]|nr:Hypothetical protein CINCED_3A012107 [Cinara cedri]
MVSSIELPKDFVQCRKSDPALDECLKGAFQSGLSYLGKGDPSLGLIELDSFMIPLLNVEQKTESMNIYVKYMNSTISNLKTTIIDNVHYDPVNYDLSVELRIPNHVIITGDYNINGKIMILPIMGNGKFTYDFDLTKINVNMLLKPVAKKGNTYLKVENLKLAFTIKHIRTELTNLFNGNKELGDNMNVFLNENWTEILVQLQTNIEEKFAILIKDLIQQFLNHVPENQLLLE